MDQALSPALAPFTFALALMLGFLVLELLAALLGLSLGGDGADMDLSPDLADLQAGFDLAPNATLNIPELVLASTTLENASQTAPAKGLLARLGIGRVPLLIWLASLLCSFGLGGYFMQIMAMSFGPALSLWVAVPIALFGAVRFSSGFADAFARLIPRYETTATKVQFMGGMRGVVSQGIARKGSAAEVRLRDRHGNLHHIRCEPFRPKDVIPEGTEVLTLRQRRGPDRWELRIIPIS